MRTHKVRKIPLVLLILSFVIGGTFLLANPSPAEAAAGDFTLTVNDELDTALAGATVTVTCPGGSSSVTMTDAGGGSYTDVAADLQGAAAGCEDEEAITFVVAKDGYVTTTNSSTTYTILSDPDSYTLSPGVPFGVKVIVDDATVENDIVTGVTVQAGGVGCTEDGATGSYYCIVPLVTLGTDTIVQLDGYIQKTISNSYNDRIAATDVQQIVGLGGAVTTAVDLEFSQKITATREGDAAALTGATVTAGSASTACDEDGVLGIYYCPVPVTEDGGTDDVSIVLGGYVTDTTGDTSARSAQTDAQGTDTVSSIDFGYKITAISSETIGTDLLATVSVLEVGDDTARNTCVLSGSVWYCPVVTANSNGTMIARVNHDGYVDKNTYALVGDTTRASDATAQVSETIATVEYAYEVTGIASEQVAADLTSTVTALTLGDPTGQTTCTRSGAVWYCPVVLVNSEGTLTGNVTQDGYVQNDYALTGGTSRSSATDAQVTGVTIADILYGNMITDVSQELSSALTTVTAKAGDSFGTSCTESGTNWYCAVPLADTGLNIQLAKDGYVTNEDNTFIADRDDHTDAQQTKAATGVEFAFKVLSATDEISTVMDTMTVKSGNSYATTCTEDTGVWYCAVPLANTEIAIQLAKDGYVTNTAMSFDADRTGAADVQQTKAVTGIEYGNKVTGVAEELTNALTTVTVNTGTGQGVSCTENGGAWYCPIPLAHTLKTIQAIKDGYVTDTATSFDTDRTGATDVQVVKAVTGVEFAYKLTALTTETVGTDITDTATAVDVGDDTALTACSFDTDSWYCPVILTNSDGTMVASVTHDGYVDKNTYDLVTSGTGRTAGGDAQVSDTVNSVEYGYEVTGITSEQIGTDLTATVTALTLGDDTGQTACTESGGVWYCPVVLANSDGTLTGNAAQDGYVTDDYTLTSSSARSAHITAQVTGVTIADILYGNKVTGVADELSGALSTVAVTAGNSYGVTCAESGSAWYCIVPLAHTEIPIQTIKDGYVTNTGTSFVDRTVATDAQQTAAITGVLFSQKVTVTREGDDAVLTGATVTTTGPTTLNEDGTTGIYYGAVILANDNGAISVVKTGYVTNTGTSATNRTANEDAQGSGTTEVLFQLKLISTDELGTAINIADLDTITFNGEAVDYSATNAAYWEVTAASQPIVVQEDGYVNAGTTNTGLIDVTTTASDQTVVTMGSGAVQAAAFTGTGDTAKGLQYALKTTVQRDGDDAAVTGATVTAGDSFGTSCTENGSTGVHYCAIPLADTGIVNRIVKSGYVTKDLTYTDRTAVTDAQGALTATLGTQADFTAPTADSQTPTDGATTTITVSPTITFNEAIDPGTLNGGTLKIKKYSDDSDVTTTIQYNPTSYVVTLDTDASLDYSTQYYLWADGVKDLAGNEVSTDYSTSAKASHDFTTVAQGNGTLALTSGGGIVASSTRTYATANGTYASGWAWDFYITVPTTETQFQMKFTDWQGATTTMATANNMKIYSAQASGNADADNAVTITTADGTYSTAMTLDSELSASDVASLGIADPATLDGRQIKVTVEVKIPEGTSGGSWSTSYGITSAVPAS